MERYPLFEKEIGEVILKRGNIVLTSPLASLRLWDSYVMILIQKAAFAYRRKSSPVAGYRGYTAAGSWLVTSHRYDTVKMVVQLIVKRRKVIFVIG